MEDRKTVYRHPVDSDLLCNQDGSHGMVVFGILAGHDSEARYTADLGSIELEASPGRDSCFVDMEENGCASA